MATKVIMPQLGESVVEGTVTRWLKAVGDQVEEFEPLVEVNTDKVDTEIPSSASGTVLKILVEENTTVNAGVTLCWIGEPGELIPEEGIGENRKSVSEHAEPPPAPQVAPDLVAEPPFVPQGAAPGRDQNLGFISPVVAKISQEHGLDLSQVKGTGRGGRITKKDVLNFIASRPSPAEAIPQVPWDSAPASGGDLFRPTDEIFRNLQQSAAAAAPLPENTALPTSSVEIGSGDLVPLSPMRKRIAQHMVHSKHTSPHVTTVMEADLSSVVKHRNENKNVFARDRVKLTFTPYFVMAVVAALKAFPIVNSTWTDNGIMVKREINIGMATALEPEGLIVPVIKNSDGLSLLGLARTVNDLAERARVGKLNPSEVAGGTFTITNHGVFGSLFATPIINQPQCGILGVGAIQKRVVVINDAIAIRPMVYLSLTFDHRILDGATADQFLAKIVSTLEG